jgi:catechol 2,3-dioxygenase-like lactoylglutathione lyase family enzyme
VFDHAEIRVRDRDASRRFYELALGPPTHESDDFTEWGAFGIADGTPSKRLHAGFGVPDRRAVDAWWKRMTDARYESDGEPGPRPQYSADYYGAFVLDPDGNSIEAVAHETSGDGLDHLWFRTRDVDAQRRFYETIAPVVGIRLVRDAHFRFADDSGSFTFVEGEPTENIHLAFGVPDFPTVEEFHRVLTEAGYRDNGPPGERPQYHAGYYGAFVLDPDGHNVEAVFHDRRG